MESLGYETGTALQESAKALNFWTKLRLLNLYRRTQKCIDLLIDVQGHQIFSLGTFNGDPHPGNIMQLNDGTLGLIDYGQTKTIAESERLAVARVVSAIGNGAGVEAVADAMRNLGFQTKNDKDETLSQYASLFFDSDSEGKRLGCATPQLYFSLLTKLDPLIIVPDAASKSLSHSGGACVCITHARQKVFVARGSFLLRGMGTVLDQQIHTSSRWRKHAKLAIDKGEKRLEIVNATTG